jgi:hypothetical protein
LGQSDELTITVTGRRSGRKISLPLWFALDGQTLHLLPVTGSDKESGGVKWVNCSSVTAIMSNAKE